METRAGYVIVGIFVLAVVAAGVAFVLFLAGQAARVQDDRYLIYFSGEVSGLQEGSPVQLRGIPVGTVTRIRINPDNLEQVEVLISVTQGTPIVQGSTASLGLQGLAGGVFIQISGMVQGAEKLAAEPGQPYPVIPSTPSRIETILESVPEVLAQVRDLADRASKLLSDENQQAIAEILANSAEVSRNLVGATARLESVIERVDGTLAKIDAVMDDAGEVSDAAIALMGDLRQSSSELARSATELIQSADVALDEVTRAASQIAGMVGENRAGLREFVASGLYEFTLMVAQVRQLSLAASRFLGRVERNPAQFLLGNTGQGVSPE